MQQKRLLLGATLVASVILTACGGRDQTVQVMTEGAEGELNPVDNLPVQFLPFDRDSLFDALAARAPEPEPQIPADLQTAYDSVLTLQAVWREAENRWSAVRDSLRGISGRLEALDQRSREYRQLYDRFTQMEPREARLNRQRTQAFDAFTSLQEATQTRLDSLRAVREAWGDIAFQDYTAIVDSILEAKGAEIVEDTTDAAGFASTRLRGGAWWVHARVPIPEGELYWNVPVVETTPDTLQLTPENAEQRMAL